MVEPDAQERAWADEYQTLETKIRAYEEELSDIDHQECLLVRRGYQVQRELSEAESRQGEIFDLLLEYQKTNRIAHQDR